MSGDPKRSSFRARQRGYVTTKTRKLAAEIQGKLKKEIPPSNTPKPSPSSEG